MEFIGTFLTLHSINRWLIIGAAVVAFYALSKDKDEASKLSKVSSSIFTGLMDLQVILGGLAYMLPSVGGNRHLHMTFMFLAIIVAHLPAIWKKKAPAKYITAMKIAILVSLGLVVAGVFSLGANRWLAIYGIHF